MPATTEDSFSCRFQPCGFFGNCIFVSSSLASSLANLSHIDLLRSSKSERHLNLFQSFILTNCFLDTECKRMRDPQMTGCMSSQRSLLSLTTVCTMIGLTTVIAEAFVIPSTSTSRNVLLSSTPSLCKCRCDGNRGNREMHRFSAQKNNDQLVAQIFLLKYHSPTHSLTHPPLLVYVHLWGSCSHAR